MRLGKLVTRLSGRFSNNRFFMAATAFISYAHADAKALDRLHKHLAMLRREGALNAWTDHAILPGDRVDGAISAQLAQSAIFVALVSPDYLASRYCYEKEFESALALAQAGRMRIVPVILRALRLAVVASQGVSRASEGRLGNLRLDQSKQCLP